MSDEEFDNEIRRNLDNLKRLEDMNAVQKYLRTVLIIIFSRGNKKKIKKLNKKYDIIKTKQIFKRWLEIEEVTEEEG